MLDNRGLQLGQSGSSTKNCMSIFFPDYSDGSFSPNLPMTINFPVSIVPDLLVYSVRVELFHVIVRNAETPQFCVK
jgi:hypothetical protein